MTPALTPVAAWFARLLGAVVAGVFVVWACRAIQRACPRAGLLVAAGVILRASITTALFFVSYFDVPWLRGLHTGDGFWALAPDARGYVAVAMGDAGAGPEAGSSPAFTAALALWMRVVGESPASGAFLNLCCYLGIAWILVRTLRRHERVALPALAAFTFSPALLIFGSQSLKDTVFVLLLAGVCLGAWALLRERPRGGPELAFDIGVALLVAVTLKLMTGIRGYVPVFVGLAFTVALAAGTLWPPRPRVWSRLGRAVLLLLVVNSLWIAGRGEQTLARARDAGSERAEAVAAARADASAVRDGGVLDRLARPFDVMRARFTRSGGNTNLGREVAAVGLKGRLAALGYGLLVVFVPFSLLTAIGVVPAVGKQAFILIADLDTIFIDLSLGGLAWAAWRETRTRGLNKAYALFAGLLGLTLALALGYVVTNYGTLFRLRLMAVASFWMTALAVRRRRTDQTDA